MKKTPFLFLALCFTFLSLILYGHTLTFPVIWDDITLIRDNQFINNPANLFKFFVDPLLFSSDPNGAMYRPVLMVTFLFDRMLGGDAVWNVRLTNVIIHGINACLVSLLAVRFCKLSGNSDEHIKFRVMALFPGIIFACHPVLTESLNHLTSRSALLVTTFYLASFLTLTSGRKYALASSGLLFILALLTKSNAASMPLIAICWLILAGDNRKKYGIAATVFFCMVGAYMGLRSLLLADPMGQEYLRTPYINALTQAKVFWVYLGEIFYPVYLSPATDLKESTGLLEPATLLALTGHVFLLGMAVLNRKKYPVLVMGIMWFYVTGLPEASIPLRRIVNEHRIYLPLTGLLAGLMPWLISQVAAEKRKKRLAVIFTSIVMIFSVLTITRNFVWSDEVLLWRDTARKYPQLASPRLFAGNLYLERGQCARAIQQYKALITLEPDVPVFYERLGLAYFDCGMDNEAMEALFKPVELDPKAQLSPTSIMKVALIMVRQGKDIRGALEWAELSVASSTEDSGLRVSYADILLEAGESQKAMEQYRLAIKLNPGQPSAHYGMAYIYMEAGDFKNAAMHYEEVLKSVSGDCVAMEALGQAYSRLGQYSKVKDLKVQWMEKCVRK